ncbi:unnamed protein product, partial [marine sediment metagenome]
GGIGAAWETIYTVPVGKKGIGIDAVVINNYTATSQSYSIRLVQSGTPTDLNEIITSVNVRASSNNLAPAMVGQALTIGGEIQAMASAADSLNINITATVIDS